MGRPKIVFDLLMKFWPLSKLANRIGNQPVIGYLVRPLFSSNENESIILPVHQVVRSEESLVVPWMILEPLITKADARVILHRCICRHAEKCTAFPETIGCLFLGEAANRIHPSMGRKVGVEEALAHARAAMDLGLVPLVVHASFDAFVLGIPYRRMLAICFCCDCCCSIRHGLRLGPQAFWDTVVRVPGLTVEVQESCVGCGRCVDVCYVKAIKVEYGHARIDDRCKGCGRCADVCPVQAITLHLHKDVNVVEEFLKRVERRTDIGQLDGRPRNNPAA
ncbi:MAG: 4Fe-4S binding protein [Anaerolineales bacterium]|nr:4Fe-4S binding protein [Anaerolineales bacterium]